MSFTSSYTGAEIDTAISKAHDQAHGLGSVEHNVTTLAELNTKISDAILINTNDARLSDSRPASDVSAWAKEATKPAYVFSEVGSTPTTLSGYGITDAVPNTRTINTQALSADITLTAANIGALADDHEASAVTSVKIENWDTAYEWGDHDGLYDATGAAAGVQSNLNTHTGNTTDAHGIDSKAVVSFLSTTIATTDWSGSGPYTATKTVSTVLSTDKPLIDIDLSSVAYAGIDDVQTAWSKVYRAVTAIDEITFYADETPTENITLNIKVVR